MQFDESTDYLLNLGKETVEKTLSETFKHIVNPLEKIVGDLENIKKIDPIKKEAEEVNSEVKENIDDYDDDDDFFFFFFFFFFYYRGGENAFYAQSVGLALVVAIPFELQESNTNDIAPTKAIPTKLTSSSTPDIDPGTVFALLQGHAY